MLSVIAVLLIDVKSRHRGNRNDSVHLRNSRTPSLFEYFIISADNCLRRYANYTGRGSFENACEMPIAAKRNVLCNRRSRLVNTLIN